MSPKRYSHERRRKFTGPLSRRIPNPPFPFLEWIESKSAAAMSALMWRYLNEASDILVKRLPLLFSEYEIDQSADDKWVRLALALANNYVPGMQIKFLPAKKKGRKIQWDETRHRDLLNDVATYRQQHKGTALNACRQLVRPGKRNAKKSSASAEDAAKALYKQWGIAKRKYELVELALQDVDLGKK